MHSKFVGYVLWGFGFIGAHRFYYGRPWTGTLWFCTGGLFLVGWLVDLFLIPKMDREADHQYKHGKFDYNIAWILLTYLGALGVHRFYLKKYVTGLLWLLTFGFFGMGYLYDMWHLNEQVSHANLQS